MKFRHRTLSVCLTCTCAALSLGIAGCYDTQQVQASSTTRSVGTAIDDNVIEARVKSALFADPDVKAFDIKVTARKGEVQLSGFVDNEAQVDRALALAKGVEGVTGVDNKVTLKEGTASIGNKVDDSITTASVKSALIADSGIHGSQIGVATRKGVVQLSGFVDSESQADRAIAIARGTEGVQGVNNEMSVKK
jgi:hyperosmotically inducible protein